MLNEMEANQQITTCSFAPQKDRLGIWCLFYPDEKVIYNLNQGSQNVHCKMSPVEPVLPSTAVMGLMRSHMI